MLHSYFVIELTGCSVDDDRQLPSEIISGYKWVCCCE
jgi:hypothetical protein